MGKTNTTTTRKTAHAKTTSVVVGKKAALTKKVAAAATASQNPKTKKTAHGALKDASNGASAKRSSTTTSKGRVDDPQHAGRVNHDATRTKTKTKITVIPKVEVDIEMPLIKAMKLENHKDFYNRVTGAIHAGVQSSGLNVFVDWRNQDLTKIADICKVVAKHYPWMNDTRYPNYWATTALIKQYLRNRRRSLAAASKKAAGLRATKSDENAGSINDAPTEEDIWGNGGTAAGSDEEEPEDVDDGPTDAEDGDDSEKEYRTESEV